eukprot:gene8105-1351_t
MHLDAPWNTRGSRATLAAPESNMKRTDTFSPNGGLRIVIQDLDYHVPSNKNKGERAYLLKKVSAWLEPHEMAALAQVPASTSIYTTAIPIPGSTSTTF